MVLASLIQSSDLANEGPRDKREGERGEKKTGRGGKKKEKREREREECVMIATVEEAQKPPKPRAAATLLSRVGKRFVRLSAGVFLLGAGGSALSYYALVKTANFPKTLDGFYVDFNLDELSISETGGDSDNYGPLSSFFLESQKRLSLKQTLDALHKVMKLQKTLYSSSTEY